MKIKSADLLRRSDCAISMALDSIGDKWSLLILRDLMFTDKRSYGALLASDEKIATNILASRLATLEQSGMITKQPDPADSRRALYFLTEKGIALLPVIIELMYWMSNYSAEASPCVASLQAYRKDRVGLYKTLTKTLRQKHLRSGTPI